MGSGIYVAAAGAVAQSKALDVTAANVANASSTAYHAGRVSFREALAAARSPDVALVGAGTGAVDASAGPVAATGNPLDLAIDGDGYFAVETARGVRYTRDGSFTLGPDDRIVTSDGAPIRGVDGRPIQIPPGTTDVTVRPDGAVVAAGSEVGRIAVVRFSAGTLGREGDSRYVARAAPITGGDQPPIRSGMLEGSNVSVVRGVVDMVKISRTYESLLRVIEGFSEIEGRAARDLGGPK